MNINRAKKAKTIENFIQNADLSNVLGAEKWEAFSSAATSKWKKSMNKSDEESSVNELSADMVNDEICDITGCEILVVGYIGKAGTSFVCDVKRDELYSKMNKKFVDSGRQLYSFLSNEISNTIDMTAFPAGCEVRMVIPVGEGGLYKALFELWKRGNKGFTIEYASVLTKQVTVEVCEAYDLDPWQLLSLDCCLVISENSGKLKRKLQSEGHICEVIGYITDNKDKLICHRENISRLNRPGADELLKILKNELPEDGIQ